MPIVKFVIEHCSKAVIEDIKRLMEENKSLFTVTSTPGLKVVHDIFYQRAGVISVHPRLKTANLILLHVSLQVESEGCFGFDGYDDWCQVTSELTLDYYLSFHKSSGYDLLFVKARAGVKDNYDEINSLRQDLIPYISSARYEDEAERFLREIYPEALASPMPIDAFDVASRLNLEAKPHAFGSCGQVLGRTYFKSIKEDTGMVAEGTVLYETNHGNAGRLSNTIIHECFHWYKHRHYFALKNLLESDQSVYSDTKTAWYWLERQAKSITPRILMPKEMFLKKANSLIEDWKTYSHFGYLSILDHVISELADFFQVSRQSAKIRLVELGFREAKGILEYIDGAYLPIFAFGDTELKNNQTFSISLAELERLMEEDESFAKVLSSGLYVYIESHLVMNLPKFVTKDEWGNLVLTEEARYHLDECALLFEYHRADGNQNEITYQDFVLNRAQFSNISFELVYHNGYENSTKEKQEQALIKQLEEEDQIYNQLSNDFEASMKVVKKWRKVTYKEIGEELNYTEKQISRLFKGEGSLELFILVCVYLNLPPSISKHLLEKSKWKLDPGNITHRRYQLVLNTLHSQSVPQVKAFLEKIGISI
ncbi:ImmA/IrrE family metallo-endopeptidase [Streptococcus pluranimalium]|uniref:ImmA/IrrE family metallo-endopeptidase n=1 Tax=Streptococcus pluranimalium TaxID=82348 RepID=UPI0039FC9700